MICYTMIKVNDLVKLIILLKRGCIIKGEFSDRKECYMWDGIEYIFY